LPTNGPPSWVQTSYQAAFSPDTHRQTDGGVPETSTHAPTERAHTHRTETSVKPEKRCGEKRKRSDPTVS
ncbi:hypothetical protein M9458_004607, partial [Cirrhinus mrigala]